MPEDKRYRSHFITFQNKNLLRIQMHQKNLHKILQLLVSNEKKKAIIFLIKKNSAYKWKPATEL